MTQLLYTHNGQTFDIGTESGKAACFGRPQGTPMLVYDEDGEIVNFYTHPADAEKNGLFIKSLRDRYPGKPLLKALDLYENELMLKSKHPVMITKPKEQPLVKSDNRKVISEIERLQINRRYEAHMKWLNG